MLAHRVRVGAHGSGRGRGLGTGMGLDLRDVAASEQLLDRGPMRKRRRRRGDSAGRGIMDRAAVVGWAGGPAARAPLHRGCRRRGYCLRSKRLGQRSFAGDRRARRVEPRRPRVCTRLALIAIGRHVVPCEAPLLVVA